MQFIGPTLFMNNLMLSTFCLVFFIYGLVNTKSLVGFYYVKFYFVFFLHFQALMMNGSHSIASRYEEKNVTNVTEVCLLLLMLFFFGASLIWTYRFYLKFIYSMITHSHFKTFTRLFDKCICWRKKDRNSYDYGSLSLTESGESEESVEKNSIDTEQEVEYPTQDVWFRYMNYQILGNYLFGQLFNIFALTSIYFIRFIAIETNLPPTAQLSILSVLIFVFVVVFLFFDVRYRRFTKVFIMPYMMLLTLIGSWMFEHYKKFDKYRPEPVSTLTFIFIFMCIVIKFTFLTDTYNQDNWSAKKHS